MAIKGCFTIHSRKLFQTIAFIAILQVHTGSTISTWRIMAIEMCVTIYSCELRWAAACVSNG